MIPFLLWPDIELIYILGNLCIHPIHQHYIHYTLLNVLYAYNLYWGPICVLPRPFHNFSCLFFSSFFFFIVPSNWVCSNKCVNYKTGRFVKYLAPLMCILYYIFFFLFFKRYIYLFIKWVFSAFRGEFGNMHVFGVVGAMVCCCVRNMHWRWFAMLSFSSKAPSLITRDFYLILFDMLLENVRRISMDPFHSKLVNNLLWIPLLNYIGWIRWNRVSCWVIDKVGMESN